MAISLDEHIKKIGKIGRENFMKRFKTKEEKSAYFKALVQKRKDKKLK